MNWYRKNPRSRPVKLGDPEIARRLGLRPCDPPGDKRSSARRHVPCTHLGEHVDNVLCSTCAGKTLLKIFECSVHGRCAKDRRASDYVLCPCPQYEPGEEDA